MITPMERAGNLINGFDRNMGKVFAIRAAWVDIAGEVLAAHSDPVHIKGSSLWVVCDSPLWVQQVSILSTAICERVKKLTGVRIKKCEGRFGSIVPPPKKIKHLPPPMRPDIDPAVLGDIPDPDLRQLVENLLAIEEGDRDAEK